MRVNKERLDGDVGRPLSRYGAHCRRAKFVGLISGTSAGHPDELDHNAGPIDNFTDPAASHRDPRTECNQPDRGHGSGTWRITYVFSKHHYSYGWIQPSWAWRRKQQTGAGAKTLTTIGRRFVPDFSTNFRTKNVGRHSRRFEILNMADSPTSWPVRRNFCTGYNPSQDVEDADHSGRT